MILLKLILMFCSLMIVGTLLTLVLFHFDFTKFKKSELFTKILFWIPIFIAFTFIAFANNLVKLIGLVLIAGVIIYELIQATRNISNKLFYIAYLIVLLIALLHFAFLKLLPINLTDLLIVICIASALSDVCAFFFGKFAGKHKLPNQINAYKTWEGIFGQIAGALLGVALMKLFIFNDLNLLLFIPIGVGSALGDVINSFVKRKAEIKNWSNLIPGHGGFTDRLSSLSGSALFTFYFLLLTSLSP